jgi:hypothetical protein
VDRLVARSEPHVKVNNEGMAVIVASGSKTEGNLEAQLFLGDGVQVHNENFLSISDNRVVVDGINQRLQHGKFADAAHVVTPNLKQVKINK